MRWSTEENQVIQEHYSKSGVDFCQKLLPHRTREVIKAHAAYLGLKLSERLVHLSHIKKWTDKDILVLRKYYRTHGVQFCMDKLKNKSRSQIQSKVHRLCIKTDARQRNDLWTEVEENLLKTNFPKYGIRGCLDLFNRTEGSICRRASILKLKSFRHDRINIIKYISDKRVIATCKKHGQTEYRKTSHSFVCIKCQRISVNKHDKRERSKPLEKYKMRLRNALWRCNNSGKYKDRISFSKHLPYNSQDLCDHIDTLLEQQDDKCPMCFITYKELGGFDIDHITPLVTAKTREEVLQLFELENLQPLCHNCNCFIKKDRVVI